MRLSSGETLGPYRIHSLIGRGGMGEVYRALDTKLEREVAIKVLPVALAGDPERLARFEREARVLAQLNHPGIASIHGVEDGGALIMELVPGPTLAGRIAQGPIPPAEAEEILLQLARALEYAHEKGIVHRDLKPANIKLDSEDKVKILDFGLAKALAGPVSAKADDPSNSPTITMGGTMAGTILGTAAYMAPEQARGKKVDKRADVWAFGVIVWEMLAGERLFQGEDTVQVLSRVLEQKIDCATLHQVTLFETRPCSAGMVFLFQIDGRIAFDVLVPPACHKAARNSGNVLSQAWSVRKALISASRSICRHISRAGRRQRPKFSL